MQKLFMAASFIDDPFARDQVNNRKAVVAVFDSSLPNFYIRRSRACSHFPDFPIAQQSA